MAKGLMDENQQPPVTKELGILFPSTRGGGRIDEAENFLGLVLVNHLLQQLIQIMLVLQHGLPQNIRLKKYGDQKQHQRNHRSLCDIKHPQEKLPVNLLFFSFFSLLFGSCHFSGLVFYDCSLKFYEQKLSYFEPFQSRPKGI